MDCCDLDHLHPLKFPENFNFILSGIVAIVVTVVVLVIIVVLFIIIVLVAVVLRS